MAHVDRKQSLAFEVLYDRHGGAAYSLAYRIVGDRNAAEDVAQEAFLSIWRSNARYDRARGSVRSWVLSVVRNRAIDALRRGGGQAPKLDHDDDGVLESRARRRRGPRTRRSGARPPASSAARSTRCPRISRRSSSSPTSAASAIPRSRRC